MLDHILFKFKLLLSITRTQSPKDPPWLVLLHQSRPVHQLLSILSTLLHFLGNVEWFSKRACSHLLVHHGRVDPILTANRYNLNYIVSAVDALKNERAIILLARGFLVLQCDHLALDPGLGLPTLIHYLIIDNVRHRIPFLIVLVRAS